MTRKPRSSEEEVGRRRFPAIVQQVLGDYPTVAKKAQAASSTKAWRAKQTAQVVPLMVAVACPPLVIAVPGSLLGYVFTVRKMAHVAWGVGVQMAVGQDSAVIDPEIDLIAIMALWAGATRDQVKEAVHAVKPYAPYAWKATWQATKAVAALRDDSIGAQLLKQLGKQISQKINRKLLRKIFTARIGGVIPVAGVAFNGTVSWTLMHQFGKYAELYYADKFRIVPED